MTRARGGRIALRIERLEHDLAAHDAALGVDFLDREHDAVAEIRSRHRAGAGQFERTVQFQVLSDRRMCEGQCRHSGGCKQSHEFLPM